jgi:hypothetical protein
MLFPFEFEPSDFKFLPAVNPCLLPIIVSWYKKSTKMNSHAAENHIFDKHPFTTGELLLMMAGALLLAYGIMYFVMKLRK